MAGLPETLGTAHEIALKGNTYKIGTLILEDWATLEEWAISHIKTRELTVAKAAHLDSKELIEISKRIVSEAEVQESLSSFAGVLKALHLSLTKQHPDMTLKQLSALISVDDMPRISKLLLAGTKEENPRKPKASE